MKEVRTKHRNLTFLRNKQKTTNITHDFFERYDSNVSFAMQHSARRRNTKTNVWCARSATVLKFLLDTIWENRNFEW